MRPRTLPAAIAPVLMGTALAWGEAKEQVVAAALCLVFALLAQVAANFANDYYDYLKGADTAARVGPRRAVASGLIKPETMKRATIGVCVLAFLVGLGLIPYGGWPLLAVGIACIACALAYTGGPFPLAYLGLGDVFVFLFFGLVATCCTYYVQAEELPLAVIICAIAMGALAANILVANNYRDVDTDRVAGKRTTVVRFGRSFAQGQFIAAHVFAMAVPFLLLGEGYEPSMVAWLPLGCLFLWAVRLCYRLRPERTSLELIQLLAGSGLYLLGYALALSLWVLDASR